MGRAHRAPLTPLAASHNRHRVGTDTAHIRLQAVGMADDHPTDDATERDVARAEPSTGRRAADVPPLGAVPSWIALPVGRSEAGPSIAELVEAVRDAGGMVGGDALFDPRYEAEMRRFLIRALEMEGIPVPRGGDRP